jgi:hypothetical protein
MRCRPRDRGNPALRGERRGFISSPHRTQVGRTTFIEDAKGTLMTVRMTLAITPGGLDASRGMPQ